MKKKVSLLLFSLLSFISVYSQPPAQMPAPGMQGGFPMISEKELQDALNEISKMSPDELEALEMWADSFIKEMMKEEAAGIPQPTQPAKPQPAQTPKVEEKVEPQPCIVEKKEALRNQRQAERILPSIIERVEEIRKKALTNSEINQELEPWNILIDKLIHYIHILLQKNQRGERPYLEKLICERELVSVHDALKDLNDALSHNEPQLPVAEFFQKSALETASRSALNSIISGLRIAFKDQRIIEGIEKLFKAHEPELEKIRKEAEAREQRATKEAEAAKGWRISESRIPKESTYVARPSRFYDWHYGERRREPSYTTGYQPTPTTPTMGITPTPTPSKGEQPKPGKEGGKKEEGGKGGKEDKGKGGKEAEGGKAVPGKGKEADTKEVGRIERALDEIDEGFDMIKSSFLKKKFILGSPGIQAYFKAPKPVNNAASAAALVKEANEEINGPLTEITVILHNIIKKAGGLEPKIKKLSAPVAQELGGKLKKILGAGEQALSPLYDALIIQLKQIQGNIAGRMSPDKVYLHLGYQKAAGIPHAAVVAAQPAPVIPGQPPQKPVNFIGNFLDAYEMLYKPTKMAERKQLMTHFNTREQAPAPAVPAPRRAPAPPAPVAPAPAPAAPAPGPAPAPAGPPVPAVGSNSNNNSWMNRIAQLWSSMTGPISG